jgi:hypothetical protein
MTRCARLSALLSFVFVANVGTGIALGQTAQTPPATPAPTSQPAQTAPTAAPATSTPQPSQSDLKADKKAKKKAKKDSKKKKTESKADAKASTSSSAQERGPEILEDRTKMRRFYGGIKLGYDFFDDVNGGTGSTDTGSGTNPEITDNITSQSIHKPIVPGAFAEIRIKKRFFAVVEGEYHLGGGYDQTSNLVSSIANGADTFINIIENTRVRYLDVPVMVRWYNKGSHDGRYKFFADLGGTWRDTLHVTTVQYISTANDANSNTTSVTSGTPAVPLHKSVIGYTAGLGFRATDDFGIKLQPEVRYTRWAERVWGTNPYNSKADQLEVSLSIVF